MEALPLQHAPLCLHAPEIEEEAYEIEEAPEHPEVVMEDILVELDRGKQVSFEDQ